MNYRTWIDRLLPGLRRRLGTNPFYRRQRLRALKRHTQTHTKAQKILFWVPGGQESMLHVEATIATALELRGCQVHLITCEGTSEACVRREAGKPGGDPSEWKTQCQDCRQGTKRVLDSLCLTHQSIQSLAESSQLANFKKQSQQMTWEKLDTFEVDSTPLGHYVRSSVVRYAQGHPLAEKLKAQLVRNYTYTALVNWNAIQVLLKTYEPEHVFMSHGIYVDWGPALTACFQKQIPVTTWMAGFSQGHFYFRTISDPRRLDMQGFSDSQWDALKDTPLTSKQNKALDNFLHRRYYENDSFDMDFQTLAKGQLEDKTKKKYGLTGEKPTWAIFTHINWDSVSDYYPMAFADFDEWLLQTIQQIQGIDQVQWVIKIHPAETITNPDTGAYQLVRKHFPKLPEHIKLIPPDETLSPMDLYQQITGGVTPFGTAALELALLGKPSILCGQAHYASKGFTQDGFEKEAYFELLKKADQIPPLNEAQIELARRYAHPFFLRRQTPFDLVDDPRSDWWRFPYEARKALIPGKDKNVDFLCDQILTQGDFLVPAR